MKLNTGLGFKKYETFLVLKIQIWLEIYERKFKNLTLDDEIKWMDLRDISEDKPEGFGVKVDWGQGKIIKCRKDSHV